MKIDVIVIFVAAGAGLFLLSRSFRNKAAIPPRTGTASSLNNGGALPTNEIYNTALPGQPGWAWSYFSDGTAISPTGDYYFQGAKVWSA